MRKATMAVDGQLSSAVTTKLDEDKSISVESGYRKNPISGLDKAALKKRKGNIMLHWKDALKRCLVNKL